MKSGLNIIIYRFVIKHNISTLSRPITQTPPPSTDHINLCIGHVRNDANVCGNERANQLKCHRFPPLRCSITHRQSHGLFIQPSALSQACSDIIMFNPSILNLFYSESYFYKENNLGSYRHFANWRGGGGSFNIFC